MLAYKRFHVAGVASLQKHKVKMNAEWCHKKVFLRVHLESGCFGLIEHVRHQREANKNAVADLQGVRIIAITVHCI